MDISINSDPSTVWPVKIQTDTGSVLIEKEHAEHVAHQLEGLIKNPSTRFLIGQRITSYRRPVSFYVVGYDYPTIDGDDVILVSPDMGSDVVLPVIAKRFYLDD